MDDLNLFDYILLNLVQPHTWSRKAEVYVSQLNPILFDNFITSLMRVLLFVCTRQL